MWSVAEGLCRWAGSCRSPLCRGQPFPPPRSASTYNTLPHPFARCACCACCRALKTKHETPKYGLIYHASLIGQAAPKFKGKISRVLAAKCALGVRVDALGDVSDEGAVGILSRAKVGGWVGGGVDYECGPWKWS